MTPTLTILQGDVLERLRELPAESVQCAITSPPYWALRDYGVEGQIGLEPTPEAHIEKMVEVFREVWRVLRKDGTIWLNYGDCYACAPNGRSAADTKAAGGDDRTFRDKPMGTATNPRKREGLYGGVAACPSRDATIGAPAGAGLKSKDLVGMPWRLALALQADGWWLRSDIVWSKANPMPESVSDRPTRSHEYVFLLTKAPRYFYDADAIREPLKPITVNDSRMGTSGTGRQRYSADGMASCPSGFTGANPDGRNKRTVWEIATAPYPEAHFATFPPALVEPCIMAGTSEAGACAACGAPRRRVVEKRDTGKRQKMADGWDTGSGGHGTVHRNGRQPGKPGVPVLETITAGWAPTCACAAESVPCTVLDPFFGSGTVGEVALRLGRSAVGIELNPEYVKLAERRCRKVTSVLPLWQAEVEQEAEAVSAGAPTLFGADE